MFKSCSSSIFSFFFHQTTKKVKKRLNFTLIEVVISLFIAAILLSVIFRFFSQINICEKNIQMAKTSVLKKHNLDIKLNNIFSQLINKSYSNTPSFYLEKNSLFFYFDSGVDPNPDFSNTVSAQLFLNKENNLILKTSPLNSDKIYREELLLENVTLLKFEFIKKVCPKSPDQKQFYEEISSWEKDQKNIPSILKITLETKEKENFSFAFFLPTVQSVITYYN